MTEELKSINRKIENIIPLSLPVLLNINSDEGDTLDSYSKDNAIRFAKDLESYHELHNEIISICNKELKKTGINEYNIIKERANRIIYGEDFYKFLYLVINNKWDDENEIISLYCRIVNSLWNLYARISEFTDDK